MILALQYYDNQPYRCSITANKKKEEEKKKKIGVVGFDSWEFESLFKKG